MPWQTNWPTPVVVPAGLRRHVLARRIFDAFLSVATDWKEVTNADPTPTPLRPFASTIPPNVDNSTTSSNGQYCAAYLSTDPRIAIDGKARLMFIRVESHLISSGGAQAYRVALSSFVMDLAYSDRVPPVGVPSSSPGGTYTVSEAFPFIIAGDASNSAFDSNTTGTATNLTPILVYVWQRPSCSVLSLEVKGSSDVYFSSSTVYFYPDLDFDRGLFPHICVIHSNIMLSSIIALFPYGDRTPQIGDATNRTVYPRINILPPLNRRTIDGRIPLSRLVLRMEYYTSGPNFYPNWPTVPEVYVMSSVFSSAHCLLSPEYPPIITLVRAGGDPHRLAIRMD